MSLAAIAYTEKMKNILVLTLLLVLSGPAFADQQAVFIDVRTWAEHKIDRIDGDPRIHVSEILEGVSAAYPDKSTPIRLYCARGVRAETAMNKLRAAGYSDVENAGGIEDVRNLRFPDAAD